MTASRIFLLALLSMNAMANPTPKDDKSPPSLSLMEEPKEETPLPKPHVHKLQGVIYVSKSKWVVWIDGRTIRSRDLAQKNEFSIVSVSPDSVQIKQRGSIVTLRLVPTGKTSQPTL